MVFSLTGESGVVYQVDDAPFNAPGSPARLHLCRDGSGRERVAKLYPNAIADPQAAGAIRAAAARGTAALPYTDAGAGGDTVESSINLPIDVISDGPGVIGVILPALPRPFLYDDGGPRTFDDLVTASANPPDSGFRAAAMIRVSEILAYLEDAGIVHGDVTQRNVLWRPDRPQAFLLECDGAQPPGAAMNHDAATYGYIDPRLLANQVAGPDTASDRYGLAVLMYRGLLLNPDAPGFSGGAWQPATGLPPDLDPRLRELFDRAFTDPGAADARPAAAQWRDTVRAVFINPDGSYNQEAVGVLDRYVQRFGGAAAGAAAAGPPPGTAPLPSYGGAAAPPPPPGPYGPGGPVGPPPGPPPRQGMSPLLIGALIGIPVLVILLAVGGFVAWGALHTPDPPTPTSTPIAQPSTTDPYASPTTTEPYPDPTTTDPYASPTTSDPASNNPSPYSPPPDDNYGAIAVAHDGSVGKSWDYSSVSAARRRALNECPRSGCKVLVTFVNGCGAVAYNPRTNRYWGGHGSTKGAAQRAAISNAGGGRWIAWVCTTR